MIPVPQRPIDRCGLLPGTFLFSSPPPEGGQTGDRKAPPKKGTNKKAEGTKPIKKQRGGKRK